MASWDREETRIWKIAVGVVLGVALAGVIGFFVRAWLAQQAIKQIGEQASQMLLQQQRAAAEMQRRAAEREDARRAELARTLREQEQAKRAALDEQIRRERAWQKFYKRPAKCDENPNSETMMQCANEHIRAKRQFDELYAAGKL